MDIKDMLNPVIDGAESPRHGRRTPDSTVAPVQASRKREPSLPTQPSATTITVTPPTKTTLQSTTLQSTTLPPTTLSSTTLSPRTISSTLPPTIPSPTIHPMANAEAPRLRKWVIITSGDFPKGGPHKKIKTLTPKPPSFLGEVELNHYKQLQMPVEVGPYEFIDEILMQVPSPEFFLDAEPALPTSQKYHLDGLKVHEGAPKEEVMRVFVDPVSDGEHRRASWVRIRHVCRLPRIEGWQVVSTIEGKVLTRYMVMLGSNDTGETPLTWKWMEVPEIQQQLPQECDTLLQAYRESNPRLLEREAEAQKSVEEEESATEVDSDAYDSPPAPKRRRLSPVASAAGISSETPPPAAGGSSHNVQHLHRDIYGNEYLYNPKKNSSSRMASNRPQQAMSDPESQLLDELEESNTPHLSGPTGPSFTAINVAPAQNNTRTSTIGKRDGSRSQPREILQRQRSFEVYKGEDHASSLSETSTGSRTPASGVDAEGLELFPRGSQPESRQHSAPRIPEVDSFDVDSDLELDLDRAVPLGRSRIPPRRPLTGYMSPSVTTAPVLATANPISSSPLRYSPSPEPPSTGSTSSPLGILHPSPLPPSPIGTRVFQSRATPHAQPALLQPETPLQNPKPSAHSSPIHGSVYPQAAADELLVRRSARLGARGQAVVPEALMKPLAKERRVKAKEKGVPASKPVQNTTGTKAKMAPVKRGRGRPKKAAEKESRPPAAPAATPVPEAAVQALLAAAAGALTPLPAPKRRRGRPKGGRVEKKKAAPHRANTRTAAVAEAEAPAVVAGKGRGGRPRVGKAEKAQKGGKKTRGKK